MSGHAFDLGMSTPLLLALSRTCLVLNPVMSLNCWNRALLKAVLIPFLAGGLVAARQEAWGLEKV